MREVESIAIDYFIETIESFGFQEMVPCDDKNDISYNAPVISSIKITMPYLGDMILVVDREISENMAESFFGDTSDSFVDDVIGEFLNIYVGSVMDKLYPNVAFRIGIPKKLPELTSIDSGKFDMCHFVSPNGKYASILFNFNQIKENKNEL